MKPFIDQAFWSDPDIEKCKYGVKLTALWLITNSQTNLLGVCKASEPRFTFETGLDPKALQSTLEALPRAFIRVKDGIFARNYIRHQFGSGDKLIRNNFFKTLKSLFLSIKDEELRQIILQEYPEFEEALPRASEGLTKPKERIGEVRNGKERNGNGKVEGVQGEPMFSTSFEEFWQAYPRRVGKQEAGKAWAKNKCDSKLPLILTTIRKLKISPEWTKDAGKFIPHPTTWINRGGWDDEPESDIRTSKSPLRSEDMPSIIEP